MALTGDSVAVTDEERHINARFIDPGSPWQNGHNESFNGVFRDGCLNRWLFESVRESRDATEHWLYEYNFERPHGSLSGLASTVLQGPLGARALSADRPLIRCHEPLPNPCLEPSSCIQPVPIGDGGERNRSSGRSKRPFFELKRRNSFSSRSFHISESLFPASGIGSQQSARRHWMLEKRSLRRCL